MAWVGGLFLIQSQMHGLQLRFATFIHGIPVACGIDRIAKRSFLIPYLVIFSLLQLAEENVPKQVKMLFPPLVKQRLTPISHAGPLISTFQLDQIFPAFHLLAWYRSHNDVQSKK